MKRQAKVGRDGAPEWLEAFLRRRIRCLTPGCRMRSWTHYETQGYPHRTFPPAVVAAAVAEFLVRGVDSLAAVAERWGCSTRTLARWVGWIGGLTTLAELNRECWRQDHSGMPPPAGRTGQDPGLPVAGVAPWRSMLALVKSLLALFEKLARLVRKHLDALEKGPGLGALLRHQLDRFGLVCWVSRSCPPLHFDGLSPGG